MEITGRIILDLPKQSGESKAGNLWEKKEWVLETINTQYPRKIKFTVFGTERVNNLQFEVGKDYVVSVDVESREYNGRWYTDVNCYAMRPYENTTMMQGAPAQPAYNQQPAYGQPMNNATAAPQPQFDAGNETDDLPF